MLLVTYFLFVQSVIVLREWMKIECLHGITVIFCFNPGRKKWNSQRPDVYTETSKNWVPLAEEVELVYVVLESK